MDRLRTLIVILLFTGILTTVHAGPLTPETPPHPPQPAGQPAPAPGVPGEPPSVATALPPLKAVLLVGPIDGDDGAWTTAEKQNMDLAAAELEANGVQVIKFYTPNNDWEQIKAAAEGAHFLFYRGHGVYWSPFPHPTVGGFALKSRFVSSDDIRDDLHLAPNAIVMLYGCFTAGSSGLEQDVIDSTEAQRRVAQYSHPFIDLGAAGYYADWYGDAFQMFVRYLFQGMTMGEAYEAYFDFCSTTVERHVHPDHPDQALWLDKDFWGHPKYNYAFVGRPDRTLTDLFRPEMALTPATITHLAEPTFPSRPFAVGVNSTGVSTFTWSASVMPAEAPWMDVQPRNGSSGQAMTVVITPTAQPLGTYQTYIRVATDAPGIVNGEQTIPVTLHVVDHVFQTHLPLVFKAVP